MEDIHSIPGLTFDPDDNESAVGVFQPLDSAVERTIPSNVGVRGIDKSSSNDTDKKHNVFANREVKESEKGENAKARTTSDEPAVKRKPGNLQSVVVSRIEELCRELNLPLDKAKRAAKILLGDQYVPSVTLPKVPKVVWPRRRGKDITLTPIQFLSKYWGKYIEDDVLTQSDLRRMDNSLFEAVKIYCRNRGISAQDYLPPPSRKQTMRHDRDDRTETLQDAQRATRPSHRRPVDAHSVPRGYQARVYVPG